MSKNNKPKTRDAEATKNRILLAAKQEFAKNGLAGARVDMIADKAKANKRMLYHYFGSKDNLFTAVLEHAYADIRAAEQKLKLDDLSPEHALETLVRFTWEYYLKNPEFLRLVNSANLHQAKHLKKSKTIRPIHNQFITMVDKILKRGAQLGVFRDDIDAKQLNITIAALGYYYLTNRHSLSIILDFDFMDKNALEERIDFNINTILRLVKY